MRHRTMLLSSLVAIATASTAAAQNAPPTYQGDPDVYKLIFEDQNFRVIAATWKKGATDKAHSHPAPFIAYALDDCTLRIHNPDGSTRDLTNKAGAANTGVTTPSHTAENVSPNDCHAIFVERK
jgi:hypothetical protein